MVCKSSLQLVRILLDLINLLFAGIFEFQCDKTNFKSHDLRTEVHNLNHAFIDKSLLNIFEVNLRIKIFL